MTVNDLTTSQNLAMLGIAFISWPLMAYILHLIAWPLLRSRSS